MTWITPFSSTPNSYLVSCHAAVAGGTSTDWPKGNLQEHSDMKSWGEQHPYWLTMVHHKLLAENRPELYYLRWRKESGNFVLGTSRLTRVTGRWLTSSKGTGTVECWHASKSSRIRPRFFMSSEPAIMLLLAHINAANKWRNLWQQSCNYTYKASASFK
jgi:hypothetical protein